MFNTTAYIERSLFDKSTHDQIVRFLDEWIPLTPTDNDFGWSPEARFNRRYLHNSPFLVQIHHQLTDYACQVFQEKVKPSYVFLSMYEKDGNCPLHVDRPQCRYTIDYLIRQEQEHPWPIAIGPVMPDDERYSLATTQPVGDEKTKIIEDTNWSVCELSENDAVCYSGTHCWHYRPRPSDGKADLAFFHFVPEGFDGPLA